MQEPPALVFITHTPLPHLFLAAINLPAWLAWDPCLYYLAATIILIVGLVTVARTQPPHASALDKLIALAPTFMAVGMAVFGVFHFMVAKSVAQIVPSWLPGHLFWTYFVGACLVAGALSMAANKFAGLAAGLFAILLLLFVLLIHIPGLRGHPHDRVLWATALRDLAFSGGALALAATKMNASRTQGRHLLITVARLFIAIPILFFAVEGFLHPEIATGVPLDKVTPTWIPAHLLWSYVNGAVFLVAGLCLLVNKETRWAAAAVGCMVLLVCLTIYVPIIVSIPTDVANGLNYLVDTLLFSGSALALAGTQRRESAPRVT